MSNEPNSPIESNHLPIYQIRIKGHLDSQWTVWFAGLAVTSANGDTLLTGPVVDNAALHGLLKKVRDLGLTLLSVNPVESDSMGIHSS